MPRSKVELTPEEKIAKYDQMRERKRYTDKIYYESHKKILTQEEIDMKEEIRTQKLEMRKKKASERALKHYYRKKEMFNTTKSADSSY